MASKTLSACEVRAILTRSGVDQTDLAITADLAITDDPAVWTNVETGESGTSVRVDGPKPARLAAFHALFDEGLANAPYPDHDYWSR